MLLTLEISKMNSISLLIIVWQHFIIKKLQFIFTFDKTYDILRYLKRQQLTHFITNLPQIKTKIPNVKIEKDKDYNKNEG